MVSASQQVLDRAPCHPSLFASCLPPLPIPLCLQRIRSLPPWAPALWEGLPPPAPPPPCVSGGALLGIVMETPTWPSPGRLAAGQGVAGMWGGGCSAGGVRVRLACPCSWEGPGLSRWEPSRCSLPLSSCLSPAPPPPSPSAFSLSVCHR